MSSGKDVLQIRYQHLLMLFRTVLTKLNIYFVITCQARPPGMKGGSVTYPLMQPGDCGCMDEA